MNIEKETIRHEALRHRDRIDPFSEDIEAVYKHFVRAVKPDSGQVIAFYWPKGREFPVAPLLDEMLKEGHICVLPVMQNENSRELLFARWEEGDPLAKGPFGVMQPEVNEKTEWLEPDILIVPFLAFDRRGYRMGYGGGYYDATISALRARKGIKVVGLGYAKQAVLFNLPIEPHDEKMDWVITPQDAHKFCS